MFRLNPALDRTDLARTFRRDGTVRITEFLTPDMAAKLLVHLRARDDWRQTINSGDKIFELDRATRADMDEARGERLDDAVYANAATGFQFRYEAIRVPEDAAASGWSDDPLSTFARWLSGGEARALLREITGDAGIAFADAQATSYAPGDFLTGHDDDVAGKHRRAAYVFGLTPEWRIEWGGLLLFHRPGASSVRGVAPGFNTLDLFKVPIEHSVSLVSRAARSRRVSVTGWLRAHG